MTLMYTSLTIQLIEMAHIHYNCTSILFKRTLSDNEIQEFLEWNMSHDTILIDVLFVQKASHQVKYPLSSIILKYYKDNRNDLRMYSLFLLLQACIMYKCKITR